MVVYSDIVSHFSSSLFLGLRLHTCQTCLLHCPMYFLCSFQFVSLFVCFFCASTWISSVNPFPSLLIFFLAKANLLLKLSVKILILVIVIFSYEISIWIFLMDSTSLVKFSFLLSVFWSINQRFGIGWVSFCDLF